jgi:predicted ATPase/DNA-binding XRE family transcriptional regulator
MRTSAPFAQLLSEFRLALGLTQSELAERAGLSPRGISDLERGVRTRAHPDTLRRLAKALKLSQKQRITFFAAARSSADDARHRLGLPGYLPDLIGREEDVHRIKTLLTVEHAQLVTITGMGGIGKTRVAMQVAAELVEDFPDGVWFVRLASLSDHTLVLPTIAETLALRENVKEVIEQVLLEHLRMRRVLLLLDNFEHVREAAPKVAELLGGSPGLKVLVTSRARLHLRGEHIVPLPPLPLADLQRLPTLNELARYPALALFIQRAQAVKPDFQMNASSAPAVAEICSRLDGLPLAIELAAAWVRLLPPTSLLARLTDHLALLEGGAYDLEARQQTMWATIAWSEDLLEAGEQRLLWRLAVFVGGGTLEAVETICGTPPGVEPLGTDVLSGLGALVDVNLVQQREVGGEARFSLLYVIREYALERLEASGEAEVLRRAHAAYFETVTEQGNYWQLVRQHSTEWMAAMEREHDNLRAALTWACTRADVELGLRLGAALGGFWLERGYLREGRAWLEALVALGVGQATGEVERVQGVEAVKVVQRRAGMAAAHAWVWVIGFAGVLARNLGEDAQAVAMWEESVVAARALGDAVAVALALHLLGLAALKAGDTERGLVLSEESLELARHLQDNTDTLVTMLTQYSRDLLLVLGEESRAEALAEEGLKVAQREGKPAHEVGPLQVMALIARRRRDLARASMLMARALRLAYDHGLTLYLLGCLEELAMVAEEEGHSERAARLLGAAAKLHETTGARSDQVLYADVELMAARGRAALGEAIWESAFAAGRALLLEEAAAEALDEVQVKMSSQEEPTDSSPEVT